MDSIKREKFDDKKDIYHDANLKLFVSQKNMEFNITITNKKENDFINKFEDEKLIIIYLIL